MGRGRGHTNHRCLSKRKYPRISSYEKVITWLSLLI